MRFHTTAGRFGLAVIGLSASVHAATIVDTTNTTASHDGTINSGEYFDGTLGTNSGFGGVIGTGSTLFVDSAITGELNFGLQRGSGDLNNQMVIYIDSESGGVGDTTGLTDTSDPLRRMISGSGTVTSSDLFFAPGFLADYAIGVEAGFAGLWEIVSGGSHNFVKSVDILPAGSPSAAGFEIELLLSDIGVAQGASFDYFATYGNPNDAGGDNVFRSDEFNGAPSVGAGNPGLSSVTLAAGDFHTFTSVPEPSLPLLAGVGSLLALGVTRGRALEADLA